MDLADGRPQSRTDTRTRNQKAESSSELKAKRCCAPSIRCLAESSSQRAGYFSRPKAKTCHAPSVRIVAGSSSTLSVSPVAAQLRAAGHTIVAHPSAAFDGHHLQAGNRETIANGVRIAQTPAGIVVGGSTIPLTLMSRLGASNIHWRWEDKCAAMALLYILINDPAAYQSAAVPVICNNSPASEIPDTNIASDGGLNEKNIRQGSTSQVR